VTVRNALLALLAEGPKYGMQLHEDFEAATGDVWPLNVGQVYTTLQRLERDGLVASESGADERQKRYLLTEEGRSFLQQWLRTPPEPTPPPRDEVITKILVAFRVPGTDVAEVIQTHRTQLVGLMQQWTRFKKGADGLDLAFALIVEAELARLHAVIRWLDATETLMKKAPEPGSSNAQLRRRVVVRP
jgi:DNA-binding PadR family transcriptional regulator